MPLHVPLLWYHSITLSFGIKVASFLPLCVLSMTQPKIDLWVSCSSRLDGIDPVLQTFDVNGWLNFFWIDKDLPNKQSVDKGFDIEDNGENIPINLKAMFG